MGTTEANEIHRAVIVEDDALVASDLRRILRRAGIQVEGIAQGVHEARSLVSTVVPDVVLLDLGLPDGCGLDLAQELTEKGHPVVVVSARTDRATLDRAPATGAAGFVVKPFSEAQLVAAVTLALGRNRRPATRVGIALARISNILEELGLASSSSTSSSPRALPELERLSSREREVLRELLGHKRVPAIARALDISQATVRNHLKSIFAKVGVHSQQELLERVVGTNEGPLS